MPTVEIPQNNQKHNMQRGRLIKWLVKPHQHIKPNTKKTIKCGPIKAKFKREK